MEQLTNDQYSIQLTGKTYFKQKSRGYNFFHSVTARKELLNKALQYKGAILPQSRASKNLFKARYEHHLKIVNHFIALLDNSIYNDTTNSQILIWEKYLRLNPNKTFKMEMGIPLKLKGIEDNVTKEMKLISLQTRAIVMKQRTRNAIQNAQKMNNYVCFDTLTIADEHIQAFYADTMALRDYTRHIGRAVVRSHVKLQNPSATPEQVEALVQKTPSGEYYKYLLVPEYGTKQTKRLHFHIIHIFDRLPIEAEGNRNEANWQDPNFGILQSDRCKPEFEAQQKKLPWFKNLWKYGKESVCLRATYQGDPWASNMPDKKAWLAVFKDGLPEKKKDIGAVASYITKYITKQQEQAAAIQSLSKESVWSRTLKKAVKGLPTQVMKIRSSRGFGMNHPSDLKQQPLHVLQDLSQIKHNASSISHIIRHFARIELANYLVKKYTIAETTELMKHYEVFDFMTYNRKALNDELTIDDIEQKDRLLHKLGTEDLHIDTQRWIIKHAIQAKVRPRSTEGYSAK